MGIVMTVRYQVMSDYLQRRILDDEIEGAPEVGSLDWLRLVKRFEWELENYKLVNADPDKVTVDSLITASHHVADGKHVLL